ncbi:hypothetical protein LINGRAHAP2_LOCUS19802 [Linum grandiflorum]
MLCLFWNLAPAALELIGSPKDWGVLVWMLLDFQVVFGFFGSPWL